MIALRGWGDAPECCPGVGGRRSGARTGAEARPVGEGSDDGEVGGQVGGAGWSALAHNNLPIAYHPPGRTKPLIAGDEGCHTVRANHPPGRATSHLPVCTAGVSTCPPCDGWLLGLQRAGPSAPLDKSGCYAIVGAIISKGIEFVKNLVGMVCGTKFRVVSWRIPSLASLPKTGKGTNEPRKTCA